MPSWIKLHPEVERLIEKRKKVAETGRGVTWALAEALAFGCLVTKYHPSDPGGIFGNKAPLEGAEEIAQLDSWPDAQLMREHPMVHVRLSGQDCIRGTFNQRHAAYYCQETNKSYFPLNHLDVVGYGEQASVGVFNSNLSEFAALGFDYGFSMENEMCLTIFEAQFGSFPNANPSVAAWVKALEKRKSQKTTRKKCQ